MFVLVAVDKISFVDLVLKQLETDGVEYCMVSYLVGVSKKLV